MIATLAGLCPPPAQAQVGNVIVRDGGAHANLLWYDQTFAPSLRLPPIGLVSPRNFDWQKLLGTAEEEPSLAETGNDHGAQVLARENIGKRLAAADQIERVLDKLFPFSGARIYVPGNLETHFSAESEPGRSIWTLIQPLRVEIPNTPPISFASETLAKLRIIEKSETQKGDERNAYFWVRPGRLAELLITIFDFHRTGVFQTAETFERSLEQLEGAVNRTSSWKSKDRVDSDVLEAVTRFVDRIPARPQSTVIEPAQTLPSRLTSDPSSQGLLGWRNWKITRALARPQETALLETPTQEQSIQVIEPSPSAIGYWLGDAFVDYQLALIALRDLDQRLGTLMLEDALDGVRGDKTLFYRYAPDGSEVIASRLSPGTLPIEVNFLAHDANHAGLETEITVSHRTHVPVSPPVVTAGAEIISARIALHEPGNAEPFASASFEEKVSVPATGAAALNLPAAQRVFTQGIRNLATGDALRSACEEYLWRRNQGK